MHLAVTLTTAGLLGLLYFVLSLRVVQVRGKLKVNLGDGGDDMLLSRIRAHANFAEYVPMLLILMALIELSVEPSLWLWALGATIVVARIAHAVGMARGGGNPFRVIGTMGTWIPLVIASVWAIAVGHGS